MIFPIISITRRICGYQMPPMGKQLFTLIRRGMPEQFEDTLLPGIRCGINRDDEAQYSTYWLGYRFESPTPKVVRHWIKEGATHFFDIGANYGFFSYLVRTLSQNIQIYAFEPDTENYSNLQAIVAANLLEGINPYEIGLSDQEMILKLYKHHSNTGGATFATHEDGEHVVSEVKVLPFDTWRSNNNIELPSSPSWIAKLDVEGFEPRVIDGMSEALKARAFSGLFIEVLDSTLKNCGFTRNDIFNRMEAFGYEPRQSIGGITINQSKSLNCFFTPKGIH